MPSGHWLWYHSFSQNTKRIYYKLYFIKYINSLAFNFYDPQGFDSLFWILQFWHKLHLSWSNWELLNLIKAIMVIKRCCKIGIRTIQPTTSSHPSGSFLHTHTKCLSFRHVLLGNQRLHKVFDFKFSLINKLWPWLSE